MGQRQLLSKQQASAEATLQLKTELGVTISLLTTANSAIGKIDKQTVEIHNTIFNRLTAAKERGQLESTSVYENSIENNDNCNSENGDNNDLRVKVSGSSLPTSSLSPLDLSPQFTQDPTNPHLMLVGDDPECTMGTVEYIKLLRLAKGETTKLVLKLMDELIESSVLSISTFSGSSAPNKKESLIDNRIFKAILAQVKKQFGQKFDDFDLKFKRSVTNKCLNILSKTNN